MPAEYEYRVVPFLGEMGKGAFSSRDTSQVTKQLQEVIDENVGDGWEFYRIEHVYVYLKPGCLGRLFLQSGNTSSLPVDQIIFRREKPKK